MAKTTLVTATPAMMAIGGSFLHQVIEHIHIGMLH
jgi:hypothetical protein